MPKRTRKDIESISDQISPTSATEETVAKPRKRTTKKAATAVIEPQAANAPATADDAELQSLLSQVDKMLTEMTQSKWLSTDWPSLEIDFGKQKK